MSNQEYKNLFHSSDAQEILNYLVSRLQTGDLSSEEALAMLSAVHADLGKGSSAYPKVYQSYSNAIKSLQHSMPCVYDYVVTTWRRRKRTDFTDPENQETSFDEGATSDLKSEGSEAKTEKSVYELKVSEGEIDEAEEPLESVNLKEKETNLAEEIKEKEEQPEQEETVEGTEEGEVHQKEDRAEEMQDSIEENKDGSVDENETNERLEEIEELPEEERVSDDNEPVLDEETSTEEVPNESIAESGKVEPEGEAGIEHLETEWPEIEQPITEEPLDGFEEEDGLTPPMD